MEQEDGRGPEGSQRTVSWRAAENVEIRSDCLWATSMNWVSRASLFFSSLDNRRMSSSRLAILLLAFLSCVSAPGDVEVAIACGWLAV